MAERNDEGIRNYLRKKKNEEDRGEFRKYLKKTGENISEGVGKLFRTPEDAYASNIDEQRKQELLTIPTVDIPTPSETTEVTIDEVKPEGEATKLQRKINTLTDQLLKVEMPADQSAKWEAKLQEAQDKLEQSRETENWKEVASQIFANLAKIGAAIQGQKKGIDLSGLDIKPYSGEEEKKFAERQYEREVSRVGKDIEINQAQRDKASAMIQRGKEFRIKTLQDNLDGLLKVQQELAKETAKNQAEERKQLQKLNSAYEKAQEQLNQGNPEKARLILVGGGFSADTVDEAFTKPGWFGIGKRERSTEEAKQQLEAIKPTSALERGIVEGAKRTNNPPLPSNNKPKPGDIVTVKGKRYQVAADGDTLIEVK